MISLRQPTAISLRTVKQVRSFLATEQFSVLFTELCCAEDTNISSTVPQACLAIRVTKKADLTNKNTIKIIHRIVKIAKWHEVDAADHRYKEHNNLYEGRAVTRWLFFLTKIPAAARSRLLCLCDNLVVVAGAGQRAPAVGEGAHAAARRARAVKRERRVGAVGDFCRRLHQGGGLQAEL